MLGLRYIATPLPVEQIDTKTKPGDLIQIARTMDAYLYGLSRIAARDVVSSWKLADFDALTETGAWPEFDPTKTLLLEGEPPAVSRHPRERQHRTRGSGNDSPLREHDRGDQFDGISHRLCAIEQRLASVVAHNH